VRCSLEPGAPQEERCDGADNDCDGEVDEDFPDTDDDGTLDCLDDDDDGDGAPDGDDTHPLDPARSRDADDDGTDDSVDRCVGLADADQADADGDGCGDACQASISLGALAAGADGQTLYVTAAQGDAQGA